MTRVNYELGRLPKIANEARKQDTCPEKVDEMFSEDI